MVDMKGERHGRLTVKEMLPKYKKNASGSWITCCLCDCDCGNKDIIVYASKIKSGHTQSCGCLRKERMISASKEACTTHGKSNTKAYGIWCAMRSRCNLKTDRSYKHYGERGISVCNEWDNNFTAFYNWLCSNGYVENSDKRNTEYTVDRINVNGNYEPNNCRVVPMTLQANNTRKNRYETFNGETHTIAEWARIKGINYKTFCNRLYSGWSFEKAITK